MLDLIITLLARIAIALPSLSTRLLLSIVVRAPPEAILIPSSSLYFIVLLKKPIVLSAFFMRGSINPACVSQYDSINRRPLTIKGYDYSFKVALKRLR